jgi:hypothetical protein
MRRSRRGYARVALAAACAGTIAISGPGAAGLAQGPERPERPAVADWDAATIDITLRRSIVEPDGRLRGASSAPVRYRWQRVRSGGQWKTVITLLSSRAAIVDSEGGPIELENPFAIVRLEDDEDGTPPRLYDVLGRPVRLPRDPLRGVPAPDIPGLPELDLPSADRVAGPPERPRRPGPEWLERFVAERSRRERRLGQIEERFGPARERVNGLDRYVRSDGDTTVEVLVDPDAAVPVETNVVRGGVLVSHSRSEYEPGAEGAVVHRRLRSERLLRGSAPGRVVLDAEFSRPTIEHRGGAQ